MKPEIQLLAKGVIPKQVKVSTKHYKLWRPEFKSVWQEAMARLDARRKVEAAINNWLYSN